MGFISALISKATLIDEERWFVTKEEKGELKEVMYIKKTYLGRKGKTLC